MKTMQAFIKASHIDGALIRAVVRQIGGWALFKEHAEDVTRHGADTGWHGFTYYADTAAFYARNRAAIAKAVEQLADDLGEGAVELVRNFNCLRGTCSIEEVALTLYGTPRQHGAGTANALAWFALEEVCRSYYDLCEAGEV